MTTSPEIANKIKNLSIFGDVSVERVSKIVSHESVGFFVFVILGPTGSGKSTFIESLSPNTSLGLSSNKLESFTQSVSIYRVVNVKARRLYPIYLVDVPGFADSKISAMGIVSMLKKTIQETKELLTFRILYLTPINNPRLPGSQRRVLRIFEALTGPQSAPRITIVSTMWDLVWSESARQRAISNFDQLQSDIWKGYIDKGSRLVKFENTYTSALRVLDDSAGNMPTVSFDLQKSISLSLGQATFASHIYNDLQSRIQDLKLQQANIHSDLQDATDRSDKQLEIILIPQLDEVRALLAKFQEELSEFGPAPDFCTSQPGADPVVHHGNVLQVPNSTLRAPTPQPDISVQHPVASTPEAVARKDGLLRKTISTVKRWGNKRTKQRASE